MGRSTRASTALFSMSGLFGDIQLVATSRDVVLDLYSRNYDCEGRLRRHYALASLPLKDAQRLRDLLDRAIACAEQSTPLKHRRWNGTAISAMTGRLPRGRIV
jgi:hypothetical protein